MDQPAPTPDPVAWMVVDSQGVPRGVRLLESNARYDAMNAKFANVVPLYVQPSALPATAPSDRTWTPELIAKLQAEIDRMPSTDYLRSEADAARIALENVPAPFSPENGNPLYYPLLHLLKEAESHLRWLDDDSAPSEGSAPDTPTVPMSLAEYEKTLSRLLAAERDSGEQRGLFMTLHHHYGAVRRYLEIAEAELLSPPSAPDIIREVRGALVHTCKPVKERVFVPHIGYTEQSVPCPVCAALDQLGEVESRYVSHCPSPRADTPTWSEAASAPQTGEHILVTKLGRAGFGYCGVRNAQQDWCAVVHYWPVEDEEGFYLSSGASASVDDYPVHFTHWMPLP